MAVAAPSRTFRASHNRTRRAWGFVAVVIIATIMWNVLDESTLAEQRDAFISADSIDIGGGPEFLRWETAPIVGGQADITAVYTGQTGYDLHVFADPQRAEANFRDHVEAYSRWPEVQEINTFADSERCFAARGGTFCFGFDGTRAFRSYTREGADPDGLEALMLLRTARKHWYRFFNA